MVKSAHTYRDAGNWGIGGGFCCGHGGHGLGGMPHQCLPPPPPSDEEGEDTVSDVNPFCDQQVRHEAEVLDEYDLRDNRHLAPGYVVFTKPHHRESHRETEGFGESRWGSDFWVGPSFTSSMWAGGAIDGSIYSLQVMGSRVLFAKDSSDPDMTGFNDGPPVFDEGPEKVEERLIGEVGSLYDGLLVFKEKPSVSEEEKSTTEIIARVGGPLLDEFYLLQRRAQPVDLDVVDVKINKLMPELGFAHENGDKLVAFFSGGWQMRMSLEKILLWDPDLLLLDELTNHHDLDLNIYYY
ncbi:ABC transporter F family member [Striga asiatica]|uniref:ABC transporter F family member n=1 Tax=Striga asiatica TaxID=4170 RepID=A0A5A7PVS6_STRAF|nr:ABC transporter F family member [Striga asiatica]